MELQRQYYVMCQGRRAGEPPARRVSPPLRTLSEATRVLAYLQSNWRSAPPLFIEQEDASPS